MGDVATGLSVEIFEFVVTTLRSYSQEHVDIVRGDLFQLLNSLALPPLQNIILYFLSRGFASQKFS